jgi:fructose-1-phosphate kinase PfkB-like protein
LALGAGLVLVSLGRDGLIIVPRDGPVVRARLPRALHGNATGAGDAAVAAVCVSAEAGADLWSADQDAHAARIDLARRATAWSAAAVLMPLAGEISARHTTLADDVRITLDDEDRG